MAGRRHSGIVDLRFVVALAALVPAFAACASGARVDPQQAVERLRDRIGATARVTSATPPGVPPGITIEDGVTLDEAVALALWNSADFQVSVGELGFARADLVEAGLLTNPILSLLFPIGPKQFESTLKWPVDVLWERPKRVASARIAAEAAGERLVQAGLDLALAVKIAHADAALAQDRQKLADESAALLQRIDELTRSRLAAGDISELEGRAASVDAARARQDAARARHDIAVSRERLRGLVGFALDGPSFEIAAPQVAAAECAPAPSLLREAIASRPDVRAAELGVESAAKKLGWEKSRILALTAVLDANGSGREGFEMGPGLDVALPIFNQNQAGRARAAAELQRATAAYAAAQQRAATELREASALFQQARESQSSWRDTIVAPLQQNVAGAERAFAAGDVSYLFVLENSRRLREAEMRAREIDADVLRARARIERAIGRACGTTTRGVNSGS
ncbi:MAG TPA: TolC family protein [Vicinamibacterales bacterium]|jgi:cobalt-zinc-cadmium efflux system outer membrane protein